MKRYLILFAAVALIANGACKFDDPDVSYSYTSVLFPNQDYNRNIIVGEGLRLNVGIVFSGVVSNDRDRIVAYEIDPALIVTAGKLELPPAYYVCGDPSYITVPAGQLKGYLPVQLDSVAFLNDPKSLTGEYVLPIRLVSSSNVDSISEGLDFMRISISYYAKQHGNYTYEGSVSRSTTGGVTTDTTYCNIASETNGIRFLQTTGPTSFRMTADPTNSYDPAKADNFAFLLDVPTRGGAVTIAADPASAVAVTPDGTSDYNAATKTFQLNYKYTLPDGTECRISETLIFRNRIRDVQENGLYINEWRGISE
ncbi:MAG: DUF1735 domain-containing protein [Bacteroidales bacterium]|jgi:hypothetical protein|nr:DUF1735 domain-containing protein [Bacteroidales bacterium]